MKTILLLLLGIISASAQQMIDPLRVIDGSTNTVGAGWMLFGGEVLGAQDGGVRVDGSYCTIPKDGRHVYYCEFFAAHFPYQMAEHDGVGTETEWYYANEAGTYAYVTALGGSRTLHKLDYGQVWVKGPPTPEEIAKMKADALIAKENAA